MGLYRQGPGEEDDCNQAHRKIDIEYPAPAVIIGYPTTYQGTYDTGNAEDGAYHALPAGLFLAGEGIPNYGQHVDHDRSGPDTLKPAKKDKLRHVLGNAGKHGPQQEDRNPSEKEAAAPENIR